ncbi:MAG: AAA family ATPase [Pyrinomonadaceae bacterium]|nr:AAA family ATPase [Pyrinomonadaceae bacterium]
MGSETKIVLTGFMGVGKTTVARFLASLLKSEKVDLDFIIEQAENKPIVEIFNAVGEARYRQIETENLRRTLSNAQAQVIALGGGAWTIAENRRLIREQNFTTVWLESTFEHCWRNIRASRKERPLAKNKQQTQQLFEERQRLYCLADWHFIIKPDLTSFEVAKKIAEEVFSMDFD